MPSGVLTPGWEIITSTDASVTVVDPRFSLLNDAVLLLDARLSSSTLVGVSSPLFGLPCAFFRFVSSKPAPRPPSSTILSRKSSQLIHIGEPCCKISTPSSPTLWPCSMSVMETNLSEPSLGSCIALTSILRSLPMASFARTTVLKDDSTMTGTGRYCRAVREAAVEVGMDEMPTERGSLRIEAGEWASSRWMSK